MNGEGAPASTPAVETTLRVRYAETDAQGVVYYANYLVWFEVGRVEFIRRHGISYADLEAQRLGIMVVEAQCRYYAPAFFDDLITVRTWIDEVRRSSFRFRYQVRRGETLLADGYTVQVMVDLGRREPVPIPPALRQLFLGDENG